MAKQTYESLKAERDALRTNLAGERKGKETFQRKNSELEEEKKELQTQLKKAESQLKKKESKSKISELKKKVAELNHQLQIRDCESELAKLNQFIMMEVKIKESIDPKIWNMIMDWIPAVIKYEGRDFIKLSKNMSKKISKLKKEHAEIIIHNEIR